MPGSMSEKDLVEDLKASLRDTARTFSGAGDADFKRFLAAAALALGHCRTRTMVGELQLVADQEEYPLPEDFHYFKSSLWGIRPDPQIKPWDASWPGRLPDFYDVEVAGVRKAALRPAPSAQQIAVLGAAYRYYYSARHEIHATDGALTTVKAGDRGLLLLRAQAEAMRELAMRNVDKPVQMIEGMSSAPRNGTPAALYRALLEEFEERCS